ncbi:hypothetical protein P9112_011423 [Eukaryota sp. TZLM1-RC]
MNRLVLLFVITFTLAFADVLSDNNKYMESIPIYKGTVKANKPTTFSASCFKLTTVSMVLGRDSAELNIQAYEPKSFVCADWFLISDGKHFKLKSAFRKGDHRMSIKLTPEEVQSVRSSGFSIFQISLHVIDYIRDVVEFYNIIKREDPLAIKKLIEDQMGFVYENRNADWIDPIKVEPFIQSGDVIAMTKFNTVEAFITSATLSRAGHSAMALRDPDTRELFIVENQPAPRNVFRTPFKQWMEELTNGTFDNCFASHCAAVWMPLSDKARAAFDEQKAWEYFLVAEKHFPYSDFAEAFSGIDSTDPNSWAQPLSPSLLPFIGILADSFLPDMRDAYLLRGFEKRLNLKDGHFKTFAQILEYCHEHDLDIVEIAAIPERDEWMYGGLPSLHCSSLVFSILKASGMVDALTGGKGDMIQATEMTPRDIYHLGIYKTGRPSVCDVDDLPYCQILGNFKVELPGFNSVPLYPHMNEKCFINPVSPRTPENC